MPNQKLLLLLMLLVIVPLGLLGWFAYQLQANQKIVLSHQTQQLAEARLQQVNGTIDQYMDTLQSDAIELFKTVSAAAESNSDPSAQVALIRQLVQRDPMLEQLFILDAERNRVFPPVYSLASLKERAFIKQAESLWQDPSQFTVKIPETAMQAPLQNDLSVRQHARQDIVASLSSKRLSSNADSSSYAIDADMPDSLQEGQPDSHEHSSTDSLVDGKQQWGWISWDMGSDTHHYFWWRNPQQQVMGQKLSSAYLLSTLISRLPHGGLSKDSADGPSSDTSIRLVDNKQQIIYQWGQDLGDDDSSSLITRRAQHMLTAPFTGWRLEYHTLPLSQQSWLHQLLYVALVTLLGLFLVVLGTIIWREYRRDMRIAEQRVTFVNQVSHELKTPLTNICMYAELLESQMDDVDAVDETIVKKYSQVLTHESQRLGRLINNVLGFSRGQKKQITLHFQPQVVDDIIEKTLTMFQPAFHMKGIVAELNLDAKQTVFVDAEALEQVLNNLLTNIEKYAAGGKFAGVSSWQKGDITTIEVTDRGPGIAPSAVERLFKPFERGSQKLTEGVSGTGIGLGIARDLCRLHGGDLVAKQPENQRGVCFVLTLKTGEKA